MSSNLSQIFAARPLAGADIATGDLVYITDVSETTAANKDKGTTIADLRVAVAPIGATTATNSTGDTTVTVASGARHYGAEITFSGSAGTRRIVLSDTNATAGALVSLGLNLPATSGIVVEIYSGSAGGTLLASVTSDGTAGKVGVVCVRGASAWNEPVFAAWLD